MEFCRNSDSADPPAQPVSGEKSRLCLTYRYRARNTAKGEHRVGKVMRAVARPAAPALGAPFPSWWQAAQAGRRPVAAASSRAIGQTVAPVAPVVFRNVMSDATSWTSVTIMSSSPKVWRFPPLNRAEEKTRGFRTARVPARARR